MKNWWNNDLGNIERAIIKWMLPVFVLIVVCIQLPPVGVTLAFIAAAVLLNRSIRWGMRQDQRERDDVVIAEVEQWEKDLDSLPHRLLWDGESLTATCALDGEAWPCFEYRRTSGGAR